MLKPTPLSPTAHAELVDLVGPAFDGIDIVNMAGRTESLTSALGRLRRQTRIPLSAATLGALAARLNFLDGAISARDGRIAELEAALLERDSEWAGPNDTGRPEVVSLAPRYDLDTITSRLSALEARLPASEDHTGGMHHVEA
jgi:hypothetical protein